MKRLYKYMLIALLVGALASGGLFALNRQTASQEPVMNGQQAQSGGETSAASGATTVDGSEETLNGTYTADQSDVNAILVTGGGNAVISGATVSKTGNSNATETADFNGVNAAVLAQTGSTATITDTEITSDGEGANAVFATGENAKIYLKNTTISTTGSRSSRGLDATYGGYIEADGITVTTQGGSCAALATDRGEGTVTVKNSTLETNGSGSPVIYSTGEISIDHTKGTANGAQMVVVEGKNSATVTDSTLLCSAKGNRGDVDQAGVMIYQSMSGDAGEGTGTFSATDATLEIASDSAYYTSAPMFFITNTDAVINLTNTKLLYGSGTLISAKGTDEWGNSGANGGNVTLNATSQTLTGSIEADSLSEITVNLSDTVWEGAVNTENTAKAVTLKLDEASRLKLTGDCYVNALEDAQSDYANIDFNGYTLYVNGKAINA